VDTILGGTIKLVVGVVFVIVNSCVVRGFLPLFTPFFSACFQKSLGVTPYYRAGGREKKKSGGLICTWRVSLPKQYPIREK
jgi:ascorbate-specific PTS system EIIC-type component UlaA